MPLLSGVRSGILSATLKQVTLTDKQPSFSTTSRNSKVLRPNLRRETHKQTVFVCFVCRIVTFSMTSHFFLANSRVRSSNFSNCTNSSFPCVHSVQSCKCVECTAVSSTQRRLTLRRELSYCWRAVVSPKKRLCGR